VISKTAMTVLVKAHRAAEVEARFKESPGLLDVRDERGRNWLHLACAVDIAAAGCSSEDSIATAGALLRLGFDINQAAFTEGAWKATPLWFAVGRGRNLPLAEFLLEQGSDPDFCLWAAVFNTDLEAIRLLVGHGAKVDDHSAGVTPFVEAIGWSRFAAAKLLLELGADVDARDAKGRTALHAMLEKGSAKESFAMLIAHGARGDIPDAAGLTAQTLMRRKKDPEFRVMADQLRVAM
jgi:ankyrin repeat protein